LRVTLKFQFSAVIFTIQHFYRACSCQRLRVSLAWSHCDCETTNGKRFDSNLTVTLQRRLCKTVH